MEKKGFTLLETVVAVSIAAIALMAVFKLQLRTISTSGKTKFYTVAPMLAEMKLAECKLRSPDDVSDSSGNFGEDFPGYEWEMEVIEVAADIMEDMVKNYGLDIVAKNSAPLSARLKNFKQIDIRISGVDPSIYKLRTHLFLYEKNKGRKN